MNKYRGINQINSRDKPIDSMAISEQSPFEEYEEEEEDNISLSGESDPDGDSDEDPSYSFLEETNTKFSNLSIKKKSKSRIAEDQDEAEVDEKDFETVKKIIKAGQLERLKVEQCKVYLRKHRLRLSGNKNTLIQRIKEHLEISNGDEAEKKYPVSSFVVNCKGDACTGDVVLFEQNVYEMFNLASRCASGPPCGKRIVAGRIVKESYGAAKQQHTFTIEVLWSKGEKPLPPLHSLLIKGRNLYRLKTLRQKWEDEGERQRVLMEKHSRGSLARSNRETRIQVKGMRKLLRAESVSATTDLKGNLSRANITAKEKKETQSQLSDLSACTNLMETGPQQPSVLQAASFFDSRNSGNKHPLFVDTRKPGIQLQHDTSIDYRVRSDPPQCFFGLNAVRIHNPGSKQFHAERIHNPGSRQYHADYQLPNIHLHRQPLKSVNKIHPITSIDYRVRSDPPQCFFCLNAVRIHNPGSKQFHAERIHNPGSRQFHADYQLPNIHLHRQPLKSVNKIHPRNLSRKEGYMKRQLCRYYLQGRCHFGDHCRFLHEHTEDRRQG